MIIVSILAVILFLLLIFYVLKEYARRKGKKSVITNFEVYRDYSFAPFLCFILSTCFTFSACVLPFHQGDRLWVQSYVLYLKLFLVYSSFII